ncbi:MAG: hypothetical protein L6290_04260 [Thermodesulfovibrionales bacterium]|nr:hypothetical protein [Thermodesulfovibrionales bacterium]
MKVKHCTQCQNATYQTDGICVACRIGLPQIHAELADLTKKLKRAKIRTLQTAGTR